MLAGTASFLPLRPRRCTRRPSFAPLQDFRGIDAVLPLDVGDADPVAEQFACHGIFSELIDGWQVLPLCETDDLVARGTLPSTRSKIGPTRR